MGDDDKDLNDRERQMMARNLHQSVPPANWIPGKPIFHRLANQFNLSSFVGPRSWLLFQKLGAGTDWLTQPVNTWSQDPEWLAVNNVVNDTAEC